MQLDRLDEGELAALRQFFRGQAGLTGRFSFQDPVTGILYANCSFDEPGMTGELRDIERSATTLLIRTNNG